MTSQLKALVDRCQTFWARKYRLKLSDPLKSSRRGYMLSVAASRGKNLFEGLQLTAKYFFDAIDARYEGSLVYRGVEGSKDMVRHPTVMEDIERAMGDLMAAYAGRKKVLFLGRTNACCSQAAGAFAQHLAADRLDVTTAGIQPADAIDAGMVNAMAEKGIDMAFRTPHPIEAALSQGPPDIIVAIGVGGDCPAFAGARHLEWDLPVPVDPSPEAMRALRDRIEARVQQLIRTVSES
jgi:protein-tyrosine-phosphatase